MIMSPPPVAGISASTGTVCYPQAVSPGNSYPAGDVQWKNTGNITETVTFAVNPSPAGSWVSSAGSKILDPGQIATIPVNLNVPPDAIQNATYKARITATASSSAAFGGSALRATAGVNVVFGVGVAPDCGVPAIPTVTTTSVATAKSKSTTSLALWVALIAIVAALIYGGTHRSRRRQRRNRRADRREDRREDRRDYRDGD